MTIETAQQYLLESYGNGKKKGLEAMSQALGLLGNPQDDLKIIHVAGTNGKGSFCAMMAAILRESGLQTGCFISPHLEVFNERFTINNEMISDSDFAECISKVVEVSRAIFGDNDTFSYFEILTLVAFIYFQQKQVDICLLEVGIGGRLDSTNVIKSPLLSVIMSIGMDHMEILGDTVELIATEKAGIIKENCPVVLYPNDDLVYNIIADIAMSKNAKIHSARDIDLKVSKTTPQATFFSIYHEYFGTANIELNLVGQHQLQNASVVMAAAVALRDVGISIDAEHIKRGLSKVYWPGRMEIVNENPVIILEGAHNLQGAQAAAHSMKTLFADKEITLVMGIMEDKEYNEVVKTLVSPASKVVFTKPKYDFRAATPAALAEVLGRDAPKDMHIEDDCHMALQKAIEITDNKNGVIFCSGSLYLIGDLRSFVKEGLC
ncbi:MAG: bifunctional folylpolyglutamate synthase/dihydrofolate synthase [Defluviitaleaceae bacterium]|nr:bifunctional folylpolyglutamate synthase/dihydrofolate synthase [Defluviitaleaceae bacterium]